MTTQTLKNLTGRDLTLFALEGDEPLKTLPAGGAPPRVSLRFEPTGGEIAGVPTVRPAAPTAETLAPLPPAEDGVTLVCTAPVAQAAWTAGRTDVVHMGDAVLKGGVQCGARGLVVRPE